MLAAYDKFPPELQELHCGAPEAWKVEELATTVGAMVVVNRHFGEVEAGILEFLHQFEADRAAVRFEIDEVEDLAADEPKVTVYIS